ncbi:APC family permease [Salinicoccus kekensis]|uniref:Amino acid/polyamine/organocation transporter (APC superfamily) n=1 Tax=Salinicoccus kekensis TaxID=714307 RepID=A0A285UPZ3_9STAP|nr:APC family permease [Salinicoccus kekensis]SOC43757.1 amino acid/polyamine/organocation transporter (APC superfamily) [Salinicoccus kekensis]
MERAAERSISRSLSFIDLWSIGVGALVGGGIFTVIGPAIAETGPALFIAFLIAGALAIMSSMSYAEMASSWPYQGASYVYAKYAFFPISKDLSKLIALWCSGLYFLSFSFAAGAVNLGFAGYLTVLVPGVPPFISGPVISVLITLMLLYGINFTGKVNTILSIIQIISLFAIALFTIGSNPAGPFTYTDLFTNGVAGLFAAVALIAFGQMQVEAVLTLGEEAKNPRVNLPYAQISALVTVVILYVLVGYGVVSSTPIEDLATSAAPLALAVENVLPSYGPVLIAIAALTATATSTIGCLLGASRMLYAAAREHAFPPVFAKLSRAGIPYNAVLATGILALAATFMSIFGYAEVLGILISAAVFSNWLMMILMNIALIVVRKTRADWSPRFRYPFNIKNVPVLAIVASLGCLVIITYVNPIAIAIGMGWIVLLTVWYFAYARKRWTFLSPEDMENLWTKEKK